MEFGPFEQKMRAEGLGEAAIRAFRHSFELLVSGRSPLIAESELLPATDLPELEALAVPPASVDLVRRAVVIKLNGGLGTGMGLEKAKSLLEVRDGLTFLDLIARQILALRSEDGGGPRFLLMNSFSTSADTRAYLAKYPDLGDPTGLEFLQNRVPKIDAESMLPASAPGRPELEWCPPGHGDLYVALADSGELDRLLDEGIRFAFVSNSDNLGATLDLGLLAHFAASGAPFLMEVTRRTPADRKGGHLAVGAESGSLLLRESAQCPDEDIASFQDIGRHRYFNTNNLWIRLDALREELDRHGGILPLPVIRNEKTLDPRDKHSPRVLQLETAMGSAISAFADAAAIVVPRSRFAPVKTTADLLALRSDAYRVDADGQVALDPKRRGQPPIVELDSGYKLVDALEEAIAGGVPSLVGCRSLSIEGPVAFPPGVVITGDVRIRNRGTARAMIPPGNHRDAEIEL